MRTIFVFNYYRTLWAIVVLVYICPLPVTAEPSPLPPHQIPSVLSLDQALTLLRHYGIDLLIAEAAIASGEADVKIAGAVANPEFSTTIGKTFVYNSQDPQQCPDQKCSSIPWTIGLSDGSGISDVLFLKRSLRIDVAKAALMAVRENRSDAERTLVFQMKQQFMQLAMYQRLVVFAKAEHETARQIYELNKARQHAGAIADPDLFKAEIAMLEAEQAVTTADQFYHKGKIGLAFLLGMRGPIPHFSVTAEFFRFGVPTELQTTSIAKLIGEATKNRPDLRATKFQKQQAQASIALAKRNRIPSVSLSVQYNQEGAGSYAIQPPTLTAGISFPLPIVYLQQGEISKAIAAAKSINLQQVKVEAQVVADVENAFVGYIASRKRVEILEAKLLDRARRTRDLVAFQYKKGAASLLEYLDAQRTYLNNNLAYLQDLSDYWVSVFQLEQAIGRELK